MTDGPARKAPASQDVEGMGLDVIYSQFAERREGCTWKGQLSSMQEVGPRETWRGPLK